MPSPTSAAASPSAAHGHDGAGHTKETIKETLVSILIAFVLAFVFRGFVVEAFVIPTGSMAPTLLGAHMQFRGPESGNTWAVGPWQAMAGVENEYEPVQRDIVVHDPVTGQRVESPAVARRSGDRILVLKFLYAINEPRRFDVVVFKCPYLPAMNYIKRLVGLPGEQIALIDGDVFVRDASVTPDPGATNFWAQPGWKIARKPHRVQETVWQTVFDSRYAPLNPQRDGRAWFNPPWVGTGWSTGGSVFEHASAGPTELKWDEAQVRYNDSRPPWNRSPEFWTIDDRYPYNEAPGMGWWENHFPVSDVRVRAGIEPLGDGLQVRATIAARGHEFEASIVGTAAAIRMRSRPELGSPAWTTIASGTVSELKPGTVTNVEFLHADQALELWVAGVLVARAEYDWTPSQRVLYATGRTIDQLLQEEKAGASDNIFADKRIYSRPRVSWGFDGRGAGVRMHRVGLDRDLYYQPALRRGRKGGVNTDVPALATHPGEPWRLALTGDEYFVCGDNSPASKDGRLWDTVDPWAALVDPKIGVVHRDLMIGKAFFVYFPSLLKDGPVQVPDFGRLRFIW